MPSGPKKRKAAKKKKEQEANNNNSSSSANNSNTKTSDNDDQKSQDERESDGGDVGSPASQDHHDHQHPFKEGSKESEKRDPSSVRSFVSENKSMDEVSREVEVTQKLGVEDDGATKIERELKSEEYSGSQNISIRHVEFVKVSHDGSSSSSSSDNESQVDANTSKKVVYTSYNGEKNPADSFPPNEVSQGTENASFGESNNSVVETAPIGHSVKSEEMIHVAHGDSLESSAVSDVVESRLKENEESKRNEENVFPLSENAGATLTVVETVANENDGKILLTSVTHAESSNGAESTRNSEIPDSSENQPLIASAPRVEQRTSWMSCCGLLDVLTGSNR